MCVSEFECVRVWARMQKQISAHVMTMSLLSYGFGLFVFCIQGSLCVRMRSCLHARQPLSLLGRGCVHVCAYT